MLLTKIKQQRTLFLGLIAGATVLAVTASFVISEKFEAKVTVRSATVGQQGQQGQQGQVESNTQTVARLASPRFYTTPVLAACGKEGEEASENLAKTIKASIVKLTTDMTQLSYVGKGRDATAQCLHAIVNRLIESQEELAQSRKKLLLDQLSLRKSELTEIDKLESSLNLAVNKAGLSSKSPAEAALYLSALLTRRNQTDDLRRAINELTASLEPPSTQKLTPLEPIYVSPKPVSPNPWLFGFAGLFFGILACAALLWREIWELINSDNDVAQSVN